MKYNPKDYSITNTGFYEPADEDIKNYKEKLVKCRKSHICMGGCDKEISTGEYAILETGFMDGKPVSTYTCTNCMDKWLDEINLAESQEGNS